MSTIHGPDGPALQPEMDWARALLLERLRWMQAHRLVPGPADTFPGTYVSAPEMAARIASLSPDRLPHGAAARPAVPPLPSGPGPASRRLAELRERFDLDDVESLLIVLCLFLELDRDAPRLFAYLHNHFDRQAPTGALILDVLPEWADAQAVHSAIADNGRLLGSGLVSAGPPPPHGGTVHRSLRCAREVLEYLLDLPLAIDARSAVRFDRVREPRTLIVSRQVHDVLERLRGRLLVDGTVSKGVVVLRGPLGIGRHAVLEATAEALDRPLVLVQGALLATDDHAFGEALRRAALVARLHDALICLEDWDALVRGNGMMEEGASDRSESAAEARLRRLSAWIDATPQPVFVLARASDTALPKTASARTLFDLGYPDAETARRIWSMALPVERRGDDLDMTRVEAIRLAPGQMHGAAVAGTEEATSADPQGRVTQAGLFRAIHATARGRLGVLATVVERKYGWEHLVVADDVRVQLEELVSRVRHRKLVFETWEYRRRFGPEAGVSALFEGPSGTGKTMSASIVARELGLDLFQIDLSRVVSRYVGETEKRLAEVFDEAERAPCLLLFDEADSLFARRTSVGSANDRYANLEVNYLLQRIERFSGIAVLTTNFAASLDEALSRRLALRITFPRPGPADRRRLWESMISGSAAPFGPLHLDRLADELDLSGGQIRNAVIRAAFLAASRGTAITQELLRVSARIVCKESGLLVQGDPHADLAKL